MFPAVRSRSAVAWRDGDGDGGYEFFTREVGKLYPSWELTYFSDIHKKCQSILSRWFSNFPFGGKCWFPRGYKVRTWCDKIGITIWKMDCDFVFLVVTLYKLIHFQMPSRQLSLLSSSFQTSQFWHRIVEAFRISWYPHKTVRGFSIFPGVVRPVEFRSKIHGRKYLDNVSPIVT